MFIAPFEKKSKSNQVLATGFSVNYFSRPIRVIAAFFSFVNLSIMYHSVLYTYTMPTWAPVGFIVCVLPFLTRRKISLCDDNKRLTIELSFLGLDFNTRSYLTKAAFNKVALVPTGAIDNQYYIIVESEDVRVSAFYKKLKPNKISVTQTMLNLFLLEDEEVTVSV